MWIRLATPRVALKCIQNGRAASQPRPLNDKAEQSCPQPGTPSLDCYWREKETVGFESLHIQGLCVTTAYPMLMNTKNGSDDLESWDSHTINLKMCIPFDQEISLL